MECVRWPTVGAAQCPMGFLRTFTDRLRAGFTPAPSPGTPSADKSTPGKPRLVGTATTIKGPDGTLIHCRGMPELVYPGETSRPQAPATPPAARPAPSGPPGLAGRWRCWPAARAPGQRPRNRPHAAPAPNPTPDTTPRHAGRPLTAQERSDLERRALAAWFKAPGRAPAPARPHPQNGTVSRGIIAPILKANPGMGTRQHCAACGTGCGTNRKNAIFPSKFE